MPWRSGKGEKLYKVAREKRGTVQAKVGPQCKGVLEVESVGTQHGARTCAPYRTGGTSTSGDPG